MICSVILGVPTLEFWNGFERNETLGWFNIYVPAKIMSLKQWRKSFFDVPLWRGTRLL